MNDADHSALSELLKELALLSIELRCSKISNMGKKMVANCITMIPGASHIGGTNQGFTGLNAVENTAAIQRGEPGSPATMHKMVCKRHR
jgi:hypothetical protein